MRALLAVLLFLLGSTYATVAHTACAPVVNAASYHFDRSAERNERNFGLGVECGDWQVGTYKNSEWGRSTYAYYLTDTARFGPADVGFVVGLVHGYSYTPVLPVALLSVQLDTVRVLILPPIIVEGENIGVVGVQLIVPFSF